MSVGKATTPEVQFNNTENVTLRNSIFYSKSQNLENKIKAQIKKL